MSSYSNEQLTDASMSQKTGANCIGYGNGASHERQIVGAGGEIGYDGFKDPRPNQEGNIRADRLFVNEKTNEIQGINFTKDGKFCCSYVGSNYSDIKNRNQNDCAQKQNANQQYAQYAAAEKGYAAAYEKGDMKAAQEYREKMDKAMAEAKEQENRNEQQRMDSVSRGRS